MQRPTGIYLQTVCVRSHLCRSKSVGSSVSWNKAVPSSLTADKPSSGIYGGNGKRNGSTEKRGLNDEIDNDHEQRGRLSSMRRDARHYLIIATARRIGK